MIRSKHKRRSAIADVTSRTAKCDSIGITDADKAKAAWSAAKVKDSILTENDSRTLGRKLRWAATYYFAELQLTYSKIRGGELEWLNELERSARLIADLLQQNREAKKRLTEINGNLSAISEAISDLADGAAKAKEDFRPLGSRKSKGVSAIDRYIFALEDAFNKWSPKAAGIGRASDSKNIKGGPFVRFVTEAAKQYQIEPLPSPSTIEAAHNKKSKTPASHRHLILLAKKSIV